MQKWVIREKRFTRYLKDGQVNDRIQKELEDWTKYG
jgi:topoisomerase IA-like protein